MSDKIRAYLLRVDENSGTIYKGYTAEMEKSLKAFQNYVNYGKPDGSIAIVRLTEEIVMIANDESILLGLPLNRIVVSENDKPLDVLLGNAVCVRFNEVEDFVDIKDEDIPFIEEHLRPAGKTWGTFRAESELAEYEEEGGADANTDQ